MELAKGDRIVDVTVFNYRPYLAGVLNIGKRVRFGGLDNRPWDVIVGVVGDVKSGVLGGWPSGHRICHHRPVALGRQPSVVGRPVAWRRSGARSDREEGNLVG